MLAQRKEIKRLEREREREVREREESEARTAEEARERELREFEMVAMGLEKKRKIEAGDSAGDTEMVRKRRKEGVRLDGEELRRLAKEERERTIREMEKEKVGFYICAVDV